METVWRGSEAEEALGFLAPPELNGDVAQIISFLAETVQPEKIFLLHPPDLDGESEAGYVDLVVVLPCKPHIRFAEHQGLVEFASLRHRQVTCSLHRSDAVRAALEKGHVFYSLCCRPEKLVYDNNSEAYPQTPKHLWQGIAARASKTFEVSYGRAQSFYACACQRREIEDDAIMPFLLHQAVELTYRAVLLSLMEKETHTHSIKALIKHSRRVAPQLAAVFPRDTPEERQLVHLLEESYLKAR